MVNLKTFLISFLLCTIIHSDPLNHITIDGQFNDWNSVTLYMDPQDNMTVPVYQDGVYDCHNKTLDGSKCAFPSHVFNPIIDLVGYGLTHDENNLFVYFKSVGNLTMSSMGEGSEVGSTLISIFLDLDENLETGFCLREASYFPDSCGYDMTCQIELFNGSFNTARIILHNMKTELDKERALEEQKQGIVRFAPASFNPQLQWVYWDSHTPITPEEESRCPNGTFRIPGPDDPDVCLVSDGCHCQFKGVIQYAISESSSELEMQIPYHVFLNLGSGTPAISLNQRITVAFGLETTGQYAIPKEWASDASYPVRGYVFTPGMDPTLIGVGRYMLGGMIGLTLGIFISIFAKFVWDLMSMSGGGYVALLK